MDENRLFEFFTTRFNNLESKIDEIFASMRLLESRLSDGTMKIAELERQIAAAWKKIDEGSRRQAQLEGAVNLLKQTPLVRKAEAVDKIKGYVWAGLGAVITGLAAALAGFASGLIKP
jgi:uncharacterized coiled-coil protein SlyX